MQVGTCLKGAFSRVLRPLRLTLMFLPLKIDRSALQQITRFRPRKLSLLDRNNFRAFVMSSVAFLLILLDISHLRKSRVFAHITHGSNFAVYQAQAPPTTNVLANAKTRGRPRSI